ncbi:MAG: GyrI-like domain-containing protein [Chloroflexota bacterium]
MISEPKLENRNDQPCVGIRTQLTMQEFGSGIIPQLHSEVRAWLEKQGVSPTGDPFIRYHIINMPGKLDVEMGWPVATPLEGNDRIAVGVLPAGRYATLLYTGHYSGLMEATRALIEWAQEKGIVWDRWDDPAGDAFRSRYETYITDPSKEPNSDKWETEIAIRLADNQPQ